MQDIIQSSLDSLLKNASSLSIKAESTAMQNLVKGEVDKVTHLVTIRQLTGIVKQLKDRFDGKSGKELGKVDHSSYPDW
ncbi:hypothetical protein B0I21_103273 [Sphingobacterium paludis]|uniref:Uncharacterized protein n=1 Tax=Sphingobacterium paludis TaxID=1476465 RepID=A0A4R7D525_9SPHI|nr:hypothetical protein B0I21_103273 [Sphingobacterium paludis]